MGHCEDGPWALGKHFTCISFLNSTIAPWGNNRPISKLRAPSPWKARLLTIIIRLADGELVVQAKVYLAPKPPSFSCTKGSAYILEAGMLLVSVYVQVRGAQGEGKKLREEVALLWHWNSVRAFPHSTLRGIWFCFRKGGFVSMPKLLPISIQSLGKANVLSADAAWRLALFYNQLGYIWLDWVRPHSPGHRFAKGVVGKEGDWSPCLLTECRSDKFQVIIARWHCY